MKHNSGTAQDYHRRSLSYLTALSIPVPQIQGRTQKCPTEIKSVDNKIINSTNYEISLINPIRGKEVT